MRKSEIFESFMKIAEEKGIVSKETDKAIEQLKKTHRHSAQDADDIANLYGVNPNKSKSKNIMEDAHPDMAVVSPAHDKLNGLVENNNEQKNILLNIVNKIPNGQLDNHKWATNNLSLNLVRLGNELDNKDKTQLMSLADTCLEQLTNKTIYKQAALPLLIIPALLGVLYAQQHMNNSNQGFINNNDKLILEINDLIEANDNYGIGYKFKPEFISEMQLFKTKINEFKAVVTEGLAVINELERPKDVKELQELANKPETSSVIDAYNKIRDQFEKVKPLIASTIKNFSSDMYKQRQIEEKGFFTNLIDKTEVLHGGKGLISDDFDDVKEAIVPYKDSVIELLKILNASKSITQKAKEDLEAYQNSAQKDAESNQKEAPSMREKVENLMSSK
jgi:hypothetical protein